jgi:hypothetical protein
MNLARRLELLGYMDVITFGPDKPRRPVRRPPRRVVVAGLAAATCAALLVAGIAAVRRDGHTDPGAATAPGTAAPGTAGPGTAAPGAAGPGARGPGGPAARPAVPASPPCPLAAPEMTGLAFDGIPIQDRALESCDLEAENGPWAVVVRRQDGTLGRYGAVVTFPVARPGGGLPIEVAGATGMATTGSVTWPLAGSYARIRGDLDRAELVAIASATVVRGGRPQVRPFGAYDVVWTGPYRAPVIHEIRYGSDELGEAATLGGMTYTGITSGAAGFEDQLYLQASVPGGWVGGARAVVSGVAGGNGTLAWEVRPGMVAYIGYSGGMLDDESIKALQRLAGRARYLSPAEWRSSNPNTLYQVNEPG